MGTGLPASMASEIIIFTAINEMELAQDMVTDLLDSELITSGTIFPSVQLLYKWDGTINMDDEIKIMLKAKGEDYDDIEEYIQEKHPYMFPEIVKIDASFGSKKFKKFISEKSG